MTSGHCNSISKNLLAAILLWCSLSPAGATTLFSVKVTVTGLAAPAVIDNNGQNSLSLTVNGTFAFTTRLSPGQAYNVAVRTPPSFPAQSCLLTGASGVIGNTDVNVGMTCKNLGIPRLVAAADVHRANLTWNLPSDVVGYDLYVSSIPNCDTRNYSSCPNGALFTNVTSPRAVVGLPNDQPRYFILESRYKNGTRGLSNEAGARPSGVVFGGFVHAITAHQDKVFVGGAFTAAGISSGSAVPFERETGQPVTPTFPIVAGTVFAIESDLQHGYYIGGQFTSVGGVPRANFAHILADGSVDPNFNPAPNGFVKAIAYVKGRVYVGGNFTIIGGESRGGLAALGNAGVVTSWNPTFSNINPIRAITGVNDRIFVGGSFSTVNGQPHRSLAAFNAVNAPAGPGELIPWIGDANGDVNAIEIANGKLFVGGMFITIAGQPRNQLAAFDLDSAANPTGLTALNKAPGFVSALAASGNTLFVGQGDLVALDAGSGAVLRQLSTNGGGVMSLLLFAEKLYVGGSFRSFDGATRINLAAVDPATYQLSAWNPNPNNSVFALAGFNRTVYAGGTFTGINAVARERLAQLDANGALTPWNPSADSHVLSIAVSPSGQTIYAGGYFTTINGAPHLNLAAIDANGTAIESFNHPSTSQQLHILSPFRHPREDRVNAVVLSGTKVFAGGRFTNGLAAYHTVDAPVSPGVRIPWSAQTNSWVETLSVSSDRKLYAGGSFTTASGQPRLRLAAYALDASSNPVALAPWDPSADDTVYASTILNGTIYTGGDFLWAYGVPHHRLAAFDSTGLPMGWQPHADGTVLAMTNSGNHILVAGNFAVAASSARPYIASIRTDGSINAAFNANANGGISEVAVTSNSAIYVAGAFTAIGGKVRGGFAKLNPDGSAD